MPTLTGKFNNEVENHNKIIYSEQSYIFIGASVSEPHTSELN